MWTNLCLERAQINLIKRKKKNKAIKDACTTYEGTWLLQAQGDHCNQTQPLQT